MAFKVIIFAEAKSDIEEAAKWYNEKQNGLGRRFLTAVRHEVAAIKQNPMLFEVRYDDVRVALTKTFPYLIHFTVYKDTIFIKAIFHTSRNTDLWTER